MLPATSFCTVSRGIKSQKVLYVVQHPSRVSFSMYYLMGILMEWSTYSSVQYSRFSLALRPSRSVRAPMDPRVAFS